MHRKKTASTKLLTFYGRAPYVLHCESAGWCEALTNRMAVELVRATSTVPSNVVGSARCTPGEDSS